MWANPGGGELYGFGKAISDLLHVGVFICPQQCEKCCGCRGDYAADILQGSLESLVQGGQADEFTWLCAIAKRLISDLYRSRKHEAEAGGARISTLLILAASMLLVAACTVLPLMAKSNRLAKMLAAATGAIVLIALFVCMFSYIRSFAEIAVGTVFGISLFAFPFIVKAAKLPDILANEKPMLVLLCGIIRQK